MEEVRESKKVVGFAERATRQKAGVAGRTYGPQRVPVVEGGGRMDAGVGAEQGLGGGIVPGSMVLVGENPASARARSCSVMHGTPGGRLPYGLEGVAAAGGPERPPARGRRAGLRVLSETDVDVIEATILQERPRAVGGFDPDALLARALGGAGRGRAGSRVRGEAHAASQERGHRVPSWGT